MIFDRIEKTSSGKFLHGYNVHYRDDSDNERSYEFVSRRAGITDLEALKDHRCDAVVVIATDTAGEKMLLIHEFRLELGRKIYGLPGGLIDKNESPVQAAKRELSEETGLEFIKITDVLPSAACTVGIGDEQTCCVFGLAEGTPISDRSFGEEIDAAWYSREEIRTLHKSELFGSWALAFSWMWAEKGCKF